VLDSAGRITKSEIPATLLDAIDDAIVRAKEAGFGVEGASEQIESAVRNFMAQRFGCFTLNENPEVSSAALQLWRSIFVPERKK
jgi:hypothetical protein